jgi:NAD(P)-dependent dehydrogenase (short-subunit alcohol dehydrogenase family)
VGDRLTGKRALISGGATGIGAATARRFCAEGAAVAILDSNDADGPLLVHELRDNGFRAEFFHCDVANVTGAAQAVEAAVKALDGLDITFANAAVGTIVVGGTVESIEPERWDLAFDVNARGVYAICRPALPHLRAAGGGSIVLTSSSSALYGTARRPTHAYAATKGALVALTRAMAVSYGPERIRVNALVPGFVHTRLTNDVMSDPAAMRSAMEAIPLGRHAEPEELAACALFLASDDSSFVTGALLVADGGASIV